MRRLLGVVIILCMLAAIGFVGLVIYTVNEPEIVNEESPCQNRPCFGSRASASLVTFISTPESPDWLPPKAQVALDSARVEFSEGNSSGMLGNLLVLNGELEKMEPPKGVIELFSDPAFLKAVAPLALATFLAPLQVAIFALLSLLFLNSLGARAAGRLRTLPTAGIVVSGAKPFASVILFLLGLFVTVGSVFWGIWLTWEGYSSSLYFAAELLLYSTLLLGIARLAQAMRDYRRCPTCGRAYHDKKHPNSVL